MTEPAWNPMRQQFDAPPVTLASFLLARIAEDEAAAQSAAPAPWTLDEDGCCVGTITHEATVAQMSWESAAHIARHDPARVLAECEAKRRIVERIQYDIDHTDKQPDNPDLSWFADDLLPLLALPYAAHEHYREEWKP